ncbi:S-layer homology domain-containing protein [Paenibacillus sp. strain BS8-2]
MTRSKIRKPLSSLLIVSLLFGLLATANLALPSESYASEGTPLNLDFQMNNMDSNAVNTAGDTASTSGLAVQINTDEAYIHEGTGSKKWILALPDPANPSTLISGRAMIYSKANLNVDLNNYEKLTFWAYNVKQRTGNQADRPVELRFYMKGDSTPHYYYRFMLDWTGWKKIEVPLATVKSQVTGSPKPFGPVDLVRFDPIALGSTNIDPELAVYLDDFRLTGNGVLFPTVADKPSGTYMNKVKVTLASESTPKGANSIYYKRTGIDNDFVLYSGAMEFTETTELVVKSIMNGISSAETTYNYTVEIDPNYVGEVKASPEAGNFPKDQLVTLTSDSEDAQIYYKYEGEPDSAYRLYSSPIHVNASATLVTKAVRGEFSSELMSYYYMIDLSSESSFKLGDNENFLAGSLRWSTVANSTTHAIGNNSAAWTNSAVAIDIVGKDGNDATVHLTERNNIPWDDYDQIEFWVYAEQPTNKKVYMLLYANVPETTGNDYFLSSFNIDWKGWKKIEIPFSKFLNSTGTAKLSDVSKIIIHPNWYGETGIDSNEKIYFDELALAKNVVEPSIKLISQSSLPGGTLHYNFSLRNISDEATAYEISTQKSFGAGYTLTYDSSTSVVGVGEEIDISVQVDVASEAIAGDSKLATLNVRPIGGGKDAKVELEVKVGQEQDNPKAHPYVMTTAQGIEDAKQKVEDHKWAADYLAAIKAKADVWVDKEVYYPTKPAGQTTWFVCGDVTLEYDYTSPHEHMCPTTNQYVTGDGVDAGWRFTTHTLNVEAARNLALVYALTGELEYAEKAKEILVRYSELYPSFSVQPQFGRLFYQTLDEAVQMIQLVQAYDLIEASGVLDAAEKFGIEQNLFAASAKTLQNYNVGKSNWQTWHNAAIGAIGAVLESETLMDVSVNGINGFNYQMANSVLTDGFWYEGAIGYHFYAQSALFNHAQSLKEMGYDLFASANFKRTYDATLKYAYPDLGIINSNDSGKYPTNLGAPGRVVPIDYEGVYAQYEDATYGALLNKLYVDNGRPRGGHLIAGNPSSGIAGEQAVFYGKETIPTGGSLPSESLNFEGLGHSIIRVGEGIDQVFALVDYGLHGGYHGHPDKLHLDLFGQGERLAPDLGIPPYSNSMYTSYYKKTFSHNTVVVDGKTQNIPTTGSVEVYEPTKIYLPSDDFGIMTNTSSKAYDNMSKYERTVAVTPDYAIDLFSVESSTEHHYDWVMRGIGEFETDTEMEELTSPLGTDDAYPFFRGGQYADINGVWEGTWHTSAGNGLKLFSLTSTTEQATQMIVGESPGPGNDTSAYTPTVVNRVYGENAQFVSILEPFSGTSKIESTRKLGSDKVEVKMTDGRTHLFVYRSGALVSGDLQYAFVEGTDMDAEQVNLTTSIAGNTVTVSLNEQEEPVNANLVIYAPGATSVRYADEELPFTTYNGYLLVKVTQEGDEEPTTTEPVEPTDPVDPTDPITTPITTPTSSTGPVSTPSPTPTPTATPAPTSTPKPQTPLKDVKQHWAEKEIEEAVGLGIAQGFGDGSFRPDQTVTREQMIVMIINAIRPADEPASSPIYSDSGQISPWAAKAIAIADELGLMNGFEDGSFRPKDGLTRAQLAVLLARALGVEQADNNNVTPYADESNIPSWALAATHELQRLGIMTGRPGNQFAPQETVTRAEAITAILRMLRTIDKE